MPAQEAESEPAGLGRAARQVAEHASSLARLELELALVEVRRKLVALGIGAALLAGAAFLALTAIGFGLAAASAGIGTALPVWAALLLVSAGALLLAGLLAVVGVGLLKAGTPVPEQAIEEARRTTEALRRDGRR